MIKAKIAVTLQDYYGTDLMVVNAARVSFSKAHEEFDVVGDTKLINYLARENHFMPFCHPHITFHMKVPIFVARQLAKHQIGGSWSEESRRYIDKEPEFYFPDAWHKRPNGSIKQGAGTMIESQEVSDDLAVEVTTAALLAYNTLLAQGIAPEEARMVLPLNTHTEWVWTGSLMFWARVCNLRLDSHAQSATREVAEQISNAVSRIFPASWPALQK